MNMRTAIPLALGLLLAPGVAEAQQGQRDLQVYQMGKDIARLEEEMREMKRILQQLLELDRRRVELLDRALRGQSFDTGRLSDRAPPSSSGSSRSSGSSGSSASRSRKPPPPKSTRGTVGGRVSLGSGLSTAFVYVENVRGRTVRDRTVEIAQKNKQFAPRYAVIQKGTRIRFPNLDGIYHNVFSRSDAATFDLGIYRSGDEAKSYVFTKTGAIDVYCNMHSKMTAEILVVPNHLHTQVGSDGSFTLKNIPRGRRKLIAWAPSGNTSEKWVNVEGGETATVEFSLSRRKAKRHLNKYNQPYGSYDK